MYVDIANKAGYTALGAPKHLYKRRRYGPTDRRTDGRTDGRTDRPSYRDARTHLKTKEILKYVTTFFNKNSLFSAKP